jgi:hypothetical protein
MKCPVLHTEEFSAALLHAENVKQLFCAIECSLNLDQCGPKHVGAGVLQYCCDFNKIVYIRWFEL